MVTPHGPRPAQPRTGPDDGPWWQRAACIGAPSELFVGNRSALLAMGAEVCSTCPVREPCARWAARMPQPYKVNVVAGGRVIVGY